MKTHNLVIYHCLHCGAVMHCEPEQGPPACCGKPMIKAAAETVVESEDKPHTAGGAQIPGARPEGRGRKPR
jgi:hypothetical protein